MGLGLRTAATVALLIAFPTLMVGLLGLLVLLEVAAFQQSEFVAVKSGFFTVPAAIVLLRGLTTLAAPITVPDDGTRLTEAEQPELWRLVRRLADVAGTRPPDQIYLTADVNAAVLTHELAHYSNR